MPGLRRRRVGGRIREEPEGDGDGRQLGVLQQREEEPEKRTVLPPICEDLVLVNLERISTAVVVVVDIGTVGRIREYVGLGVLY